MKWNGISFKSSRLKRKRVEMKRDWELLFLKLSAERMEIYYTVLLAFTRLKIFIIKNLIISLYYITIIITITITILYI